jgi:3-oxoacyl-(acyl-carrier-protein) synthase
VRPEQIGYVNAHATSTPKGDVAEATAIRSVFGPHADRLPVNAPKSFLGHTCWSAATVEAVTAIASVARGVLYPCANLDEVDPAVDLDLVRAPRKVDVDYFLKNAFGFGGLNSIALFRRWHEGGRP